MNGCIYRIHSLLKSEKGDVKVCRALDEMFEESINKGIQMGIKQGIEQGIERGIERGIEQGVELGQVLLYKTMIKDGMSVNEISKVCSISVENLKRALNI